MPIYSDEDKNNWLGLTGKLLSSTGLSDIVIHFALRERDQEYDGCGFLIVFSLNCYMLEYVNKDNKVKNASLPPPPIQTSLLTLTARNLYRKI